VQIYANHKKTHDFTMYHNSRYYATANCCFYIEYQQPLHFTGFQAILGVSVLGAGVGLGLVF